MTLVSATSERAVVRVVDALPAYDVVDAQGVVVAHARRRLPRAFRLTLLRRDGRWVIAAVRPA